MLHTLDARLAQAHAGELGHLDFLQVLCHDEITRRETMAMARRLRRARFDQTQPPWKSSTSPPARNCPPRRSATSPRCAGCKPASRSSCYGPVGVGKTHVAQALGHLAIRRGADVRFTKTSRALADLAGGHADRTWPRRLAELVRPALLILDDFAMRELTAQQADDLYELISERAQAGRSLIATSNRSPADWYPLFPNPVVAESLLDRLINTSHQVFMNGPSYRPNKRPGRAGSTTSTEHQVEHHHEGPPPGELRERRPGELRERRHTRSVHGGIFTTSTPSSARTASNEPVNLLSRSRTDPLASRVDRPPLDPARAVRTATDQPGDP